MRSFAVLVALFFGFFAFSALGAEAWNNFAFCVAVVMLACVVFSLRELCELLKGNQDLLRQSVSLLEKIQKYDYHILRKLDPEFDRPPFSAYRPPSKPHSEKPAVNTIVVT